jgi:S1-C subfamily serine protease
VWDLAAGAPAIGLEARTVPPEWSSQTGVVGGVEIGSVQPGGAAERSGLLRGDVIVRVGNVTVSTMNDFAAAVRRELPGSSVVLTVWRMGRETTVTLTLPSLATDGLA